MESSRSRAVTVALRALAGCGVVLLVVLAGAYAFWGVISFGFQITTYCEDYGSCSDPEPVGAIIIGMSCLVGAVLSWKLAAATWRYASFGAPPSYARRLALANLVVLAVTIAVSASQA